MTSLEAIWSRMEADAPPASGSARRRIFGDSRADLNVTLTLPGPVRGLALTVAEESLPPAVELPTSREIEHRQTPAPRQGRTILEIRLTDAGANDIFAALAADVAERVAATSTDEAAIGEWLSRIRRWQRLLAAAPAGLGPERQRGLYAELRFLRDRLAPAVGLAPACAGWEGPKGGHDFQVAGGAFEVKSSASNRPQVAQISSERQLDETGTDSLHLVHYSLDIHQHAGETLPEIVDELRNAAQGSAAEDDLDDRLFQAGFADTHRQRYETTGYTVREESFFKVGPGFPRLIEAELPDGIGAVSYSLVIDMCAPFKVASDNALLPVAPPK